jgi:hypothetical protein
MNAALDAAFEAMRRRIGAPAWADDIYTLPAPVGTEWDALAEPAPPQEWSVARHAVLADLRRIEPRHKLAVLSMASNEAPYLAEWIAHHLAIGVEKIFVYTNNNDDGTDEVLRWFAGCAPVVPIPVTVMPGVNVQQKNYRHALFLLPELRLYEWVAVLDVDEFLLPDARYGHNLRNLLAAAPADTETIIFPWHWRAWPRDFARGPGLLAERFGHAGPSNHVKSVTRLRHVMSLEQVHVPEYDRPVAVRDSAFTLVAQEDDWTRRQQPGTGGWVEHFWGKSFEEFLIKQRRGEVLALSAKPFRRATEEFFKWAPPVRPGNAAPWPDAMLDATKEKLAQFAARPGFTALQDMVERRYAAYAATVRDDAKLRAIYDEMIVRFPK